MTSSCVLRVAVLTAISVACMAEKSAHLHAERGTRPNLRGGVEAVLPDIVATYRWFHAHPELSGEEEKTAQRLAEELRALKLEVHTNIGGHGVVGILRGGGKGSGPVVLYRADMDALPITEATGKPYASKNPGVMHACGHDIHMATALGALGVLSARRGQWKGTILFVGQPAEETGRGARAVLKDPRFKRIMGRVGKPTIALAVHTAADMPAGQIAVHSGYVTANVDSVSIIMHGKGGHGAMPHRAVDPIVMGSELVMSLQTIVSRRIPPGERAVVTVGKFAAGTKHNIIPPRATLLLTVRSYSDDTRSFLLREIERMTRSIAASHGAPRQPEISVRENHTPSGFNDVAWAARLRTMLAGELGGDNVGDHEPTLGGEDFARYSRELGIPGIMWKLGTVVPEDFARAKGKRLPSLHSDAYAPDAERTLRTGILAMTLSLLETLNQP
ncbi:MAG: amidohydrolase [Proteobacteria bacterium]|nr:amidohydrolase [Pseudomonadota bacterium]